MASTSAIVWVKIPTIPASGTTTIYMYYGNPSATDASNGPATFDFFDDFNDGTVDTNKWTITGDIIETGGYLQVGGTTTSIAQQNVANYPLFSRGYALRERGFVSGSGYVYIGFSDTGITRFAMGPHGANGYYTYDGTIDRSTPGVGQTSYAVYDTLWTASNVKYYQNDVLAATHDNPPSVPMGPYLRSGSPPYYASCDWILIRKCASSEPSVAMGDEEEYGPIVMHYYHGSPQQMGDVAETWVWSNFTWHNPTVPSGTTVSWKIYYVDASGNWNSTDTKTFNVRALVGDVNGDGFVDIFDMRAVAAYFDVKQGDPLWSAASAYDLNGNGVIDIYDLVLIGANFS